MNEYIWESLKNRKTFRLPPLSKLSQLQVDELSSIRKSLKAPLEFLGLKTLSTDISKKKDGYSFRMQCKVKKCRAMMRFHVQLTEEYGTLRFQEKCRHH